MSDTILSTAYSIREPATGQFSGYKTVIAIRESDGIAYETETIFSNADGESVFTSPNEIADIPGFVIDGSLNVLGASTQDGLPLGALFSFDYWRLPPQNTNLSFATMTNAELYRILTNRLFGLHVVYTISPNGVTVNDGNTAITGDSVLTFDLITPVGESAIPRNCQKGVDVEFVDTLTGVDIVNFTAPYSFAATQSHEFVSASTDTFTPTGETSEDQLIIGITWACGFYRSPDKPPRLYFCTALFCGVGGALFCYAPLESGDTGLIYRDSVASGVADIFDVPDGMTAIAERDGPVLFGVQTKIRGFSTTPLTMDIAITERTDRIP